MKLHTFSLFLFLLLLGCPVSYVKAALPNDSVDTYTNNTVTDSVYVQGRSVLSISDVCVSSGGHLVASSPDGIIITGGFQVALGGKLSLYERRICNVTFSYDECGNVIRRKKKWQAK
jgi:hypothetical protein